MMKFRRAHIVSMIAAAGLIAASAAPVAAEPQGPPSSGINNDSAAQPSSLEAGQVSDTAAGTVDYTVYLPAGYDPELPEKYPSLYLLHGRGDSQAAWQRMQGTLDTMIEQGRIQPMVVVMPDAPWNDRGNWYTDSLYTGSASSGAGVAVETAFTQDLVAHIDATYATAPSREARAVGGYSMGGAGALRYALAHQDTFSAGIILSPAAYSPQPPSDSSARDYGAYGVGEELFNADRYTELSYPTALKNFDPTLPVHLFIAVGDDEWATPVEADAQHDIDFESAKLYNTARRVPGITAELRIRDGGHDWDVWAPAFEEAIVDISSRLRTSPAPDWEAQLFGSPGSDWAGGIAELDAKTAIIALNLADSWNEYEPIGGLDTVVAAVNTGGDVLWHTPLATPGNDRAYGVVQADDSSYLVAGYSRGRFGTPDVAGNDDAFVAKFNTQGELMWVQQYGDPDSNDRFYAITADNAGGAYVAGYTNGSFAGDPHMGDKDAVLARISGEGDLLWSRQIGGSGEDKALAVALRPDGGVVVGGNHGNGMPGAPHMGDYDGWVSAYDAHGTQQWIHTVGSPLNEQVSGLAVSGDVVVATGHTKGALGEESLGDNDVFARAFSLQGDELWTQQFGTETDDRGAAIVAQADGSFALLINTYGAMGETFGSVDMARVVLQPDGSLGEAFQFGSPERDGADEWDEANLFAGAGSAGLWVSGVTWGAPADTVNAGASDVFVMLLADPAAEPEPTPTITPTTAPTEDPTEDPTEAPTESPTNTPTAAPTSEGPVTKPSDEASSTPATDESTDDQDEDSTPAASDGEADDHGGLPTDPATDPTDGTQGAPGEGGGLDASDELGATGVNGVAALVVIAVLLAGLGAALIARRRRVSLRE